MGFLGENKLQIMFKFLKILQKKQITSIKKNLNNEKKQHKMKN